MMIHPRFLPALLSAALVACQATPTGLVTTTVPQMGQAPSTVRNNQPSLTTRLSGKPGWRRLARPKSSAPAPIKPQVQPIAPPANLPALDVRVERQGNHDRLVFGPRAQSEFRTQAVDLSQLDAVEIKVYGSDLATPISSGLVNLAIPGVISAADLANVVLPAIPLGGNRVVVVQYYDNGVAVPWAAAADFYTASAGGSRALNFERRKLPLARIIIALLASNPSMVNSLDLALLQAEIDVVMGPLFGSPARFSAVDPELVDVTKYHNDLVAAGGSVTALKADPGYDNLSYRQSAPSLDIAVTGLTHNPITGADPFADKVDVRLGDTSSVPQLDSVNGTTFISNVVPGTWPLEVTLPAGVSYQILGTSSSQFNNASLETLNNGRVKIKAEVEITGATNLQLNLNRVQPVVSSISTQNGTRGSTFVISGENFHTQPGGNQVIFDGATDFPAEVVSATATELVVKVPQVDVSGNYTVQVGYSKPVDADTGDLSAIQASDPHLFNVTTVWYVKHDGVAGANGDKWEVAVPLYDALARAGNNDEIWIQQGVYKPSHILVYDDITETYSAETPADPRAASFTLANNIKLLGGFAGTELSSSERNPQTRPVVFDGDLLGNDGLSSPPTAAELNPDRTERSDNSYNVVTVFGQNTVIDGITITGGNASDLTDDTYLTDPEGCDPVNDPDNCYIYETQYNLRKRGGGLVNQGDVTLRDVTIRFNSARGDGGGIFAQSNNPGSGLHLTSSKYVDAGGMTEYDGNRTGQLSYNLIEDNLAGQNGGGIYDATAGRPGATILRRNRAGNDGGGMYAAEGFEGSNELSDFIFEANHADRNGGGYTSYRQNSLNFRRSVFFNNSASNFGGGVYYEGGGGEINGDSNVFANNTALKGGGFYYEFMNLVGIPPQFIETKTITHASFVNNQATDASGTGGGAFYLSGLRSINFVSSIFFGNDVARGGDNIGFDFSSSLSDAANREALVKHDGSPAGTGFINAVDNGSNLYGRTNAAEIFSNINALPGSLGWASADDGLRPPSNSPAKGIGVWADDRRDLRGGLRLNPSTIGAYEAHEGP